jgi:hypothetical protein
MSVGEPLLTIRPPRLALLWVAGFGLFWISTVVWFLVGALRGDSSAGAAVVVPVVMLLLGGTIIARMLRVGVWAYADELVVRGALRSRRIPRGEVEDFRVGSAPGGQFGKTLLVLTRDGDTVPLEPVASLGRFGRDTLADRREELRRWAAVG